MDCRTFPRKCGGCRERTVYDARLPSYSASMTHDGMIYEVVIADFDVHKCRECGYMSFDKDACRRLSDGLRAAAGILQPDEIRDGREAMGLTREGLGNLLGIGGTVVSRWEGGDQIQDRHMDGSLRSLFGDNIITRGDES